MTQMGHVGPMLGQVHHFRNYAPEKIPYAIDRYVNEGKRLYNVLDRRLDEAEWLGGAEYTIADMATFPWIRIHENQGIDIGDYPNVKRWVDTIAARPAVERGVQVLADRRRGRPHGREDEGDALRLDPVRAPLSGRAPGLVSAPSSSPPPSHEVPGESRRGRRGRYDGQAAAPRMAP